MYEQFYQLSADPFRLAPDPRFCFRHRSYARAQAYMDHALGQGEGFIMVTGRPGTGKTTLVEQFIAESPPNSLTSGCLLSTQIGADDLLRMVAYAFELNGQGLDKATLLYRFEQLLIEIRESGRQALLIIDEAQNLTPRALEELRLLTNLRLKYQPLLQVFLVGQEQLQRFLNSPEMEQLRQRLLATCQLEPLNLAETHAYVEHRLRCAGWNADPHLTKEVFPLVHRFSEGYPRYINRACSRVLLYGAVEGKHELRSGDVAHALLELCHERVGPQGTVDVESPDIRTPTMELLHAAREGGDWMPRLSSEERAFIGKPDTAMSDVSAAPTMGAPPEPSPDGLPPGEPGQPQEQSAFWDAYAQAQMPAPAAPPDLAPDLPETGDGESDWRESLYQRRVATSSADAPEQASASAEPPPVDVGPAGGRAPAPEAREPVPAPGGNARVDALPATSASARRWRARLQGAGAMAMRHRVAALGLVLFGALVLQGILSGDEGRSERADDAAVTSAAQKPKFGPPQPADRGLQMPTGMIPNIPLAEALAAIGPEGLMPPPRIDDRPPDVRQPAPALIAREQEFAARARRETPASNGGPEPESAGGADAESPPPVDTERPGDRPPPARNAEEDTGTMPPGDPGEGLAHAGQSAAQDEPPSGAEVNQPVANVHRPPASRTANPSTTVAAAEAPSQPEAAHPLEKATGSEGISDPVDPRKNRIEHLIALAQAAFEEHRLTIPAKASAYDYYREVLELDPDNTEAASGIGRVVRRYQTLAAGRIERARYGEARQFIRRGLRVRPGDDKLLSLSDKLSTLPRDVKDANKENRSNRVRDSRNALMPPRNPQPFIIELSTPAQERQGPEGLFERIKGFFSGTSPETTRERFDSNPGD